MPDISLSIRVRMHPIALFTVRSPAILCFALFSFLFIGADHAYAQGNPPQTGPTDIVNSAQDDGAGLAACAGTAVEDQRAQPHPVNSSSACNAGASALELDLPDLTIVKNVAPAQVLPGQPLTYTITYTNVGSRLALSLKVSDDFPDGLEDLSASPAPDSGSVLSTAVWQETLFGIGASKTIVVTARAPLSTVVDTTVTNATVVDALFDDNSSNDRSEAKLDIVLPRVGFTLAENLVGESNGVATVEIALDRIQPYRAVQVTYSTTEESAENGVDFTAVAGTAVIAAGTQSTTIELPIVGDDEEESNETALLVLQDPDGALLDNASTTRLTIIDDDAPPIPAAVNVGPVNGPTTEDGGTASFSVSLSRAPSTSVDVMFTSDDPTEGTVVPAVEFTTENWSNPVAVSVTGMDDAVTDGDVHYSVITTLVTDDPDFATVDPDDVTVINLDNEESTCLRTNLSWVGACELELSAGIGETGSTLEVNRSLGDMRSAQIQQVLDDVGQSRWYKFAVEPNSQLLVTLTDLPDNYDITLYKDISATIQSELTVKTADDLNRLGAEFAPAAFSPAAFSPAAFSPAAFSPAAFSPAAFSPAAFSPAAFSPAAFSPVAFSPAAFSPAAFSPAAFSPAVFSPAAFSPAAFSPAAFSSTLFSPIVYSPAAFSPAAFSGAESRSLLAVSAFEGRANEGVFLYTWESTGDFYIRVRGRNGVHDPEADYTLTVALTSGMCNGVNRVLPSRSLPPVAGEYKTLILVDETRMYGAETLLAPMRSALTQLAARPEVAGIIVDVGQDARVAAANEQADANPACPYAKNLVAYAVKELIDSFWAENPLEYLILAGNDDVIPFFRHPDESNLGNERDFVPPVFDATTSQASLKLGYMLGQDRYGAQTEISVRSGSMPLPDLAVGRLVETPAEIEGMVRAYLATESGVAPPVNETLVTGYDFLADIAQAMATEFGTATGRPATELIAARDRSPEDPGTWTADDLRNTLFTKRFDLGYLAGHFSASGALAADFSTSVHAKELATSPVDLTNAVFFSNGCHSGYNIVEWHGIPSVTSEPDWAQAFARKHATLIAGTGYQYGDTDFIEYGERLYLEFARRLRTGPEPVPVGKALVAAKRQYLSDTTQLRPLDEKSLIVSTLFGLPMLKVDLRGERLTEIPEASLISSAVQFETNPGLTLGLYASDMEITPRLQRTDIPLVDFKTGMTLTASYWSGPDGLSVNPVEPVLPQANYNVELSDPADKLALRGVGLRGGSYRDLSGVSPLVAAATTEIRGVHPIFATETFFPVRPWEINYWSAIVGSGAVLQVTPAQYRSDEEDVTMGRMRLYDSLSFRLFYSGNTETYGDGITPSTANAPSITNVRSVIENGTVYFKVNVTGHPSAGIQEVWLVHTTPPHGDSADAVGMWLPLDLRQNMEDTTLWEGNLDLLGLDPERMRFMVQAVNGVGLVTMDDNLGHHFIPGRQHANLAQSGSELAIVSSPESAVYGSEVTIAVRLTAQGVPLENQWVHITVGDFQRPARTNSTGIAETTVHVLGHVGDTEVQASYRGTALHAESMSLTKLKVIQNAPTIDLHVKSNVMIGDRLYPIVEATVLSQTGQPLSERTVIFTLTGPDGKVYNVPVITDYAGRAILDLSRMELPDAEAEYQISVAFAKILDLGDGNSVDLTDERYVAAEAVTTATVMNMVDRINIWLPIIVADR